MRSSCFRGFHGPPILGLSKRGWCCLLMAMQLLRRSPSLENKLAGKNALAIRQSPRRMEGWERSRPDRRLLVLQTRLHPSQNAFAASLHESRDLGKICDWGAPLSDLGFRESAAS